MNTQTALLCLGLSCVLCVRCAVLVGAIAADSMAENGSSTGAAKRVTSATENVRQLIGSLREATKEMLSLRSSGDSKGLQVLATKASVLCAMLKAQSREALLGVEACREEVLDNKKELDLHHLQLQNLLYERNHLQQEIRRCKAFGCVVASCVAAASVPCLAVT